MVSNPFVHYFIWVYYTVVGIAIIGVCIMAFLALCLGVAYVKHKLRPRR